jgi:predicted nucleotidyltransferase
MYSELKQPIELLNGRLAVDPAELLDRSRATERDVVVLSGTLLEGFGNIYSDLDLYVIGEKLPTGSQDVTATLVIREDGRLRRVNETLSDSANILLDVQYYTLEELETLARSLRALYLESRQSTELFSRCLLHEDEDLIHKLLTGRILRDGTGTFDARGTFDPGMFCFLKYRNQVGGYAELRDLAGSWAAGDLDTCLYNTRNYLISQVSGMMFLAGNTNPRPKWFVRRLASLDDSYTGLRKGVMSWMECARHTQSQKRAAVEAACDLIDTTYQHARELLGSNARYFSVQEAMELTDRELGARGTRDGDTLAEWHMRRRMFNAAEGSMMAQIREMSDRAPGVSAMVGQSRIAGPV